MRASGLRARMIAAAACSCTRWVSRLKIDQTGSLERSTELLLGERAGDAPRPRGHVRAGRVVHVGVGDHVRDGEPAAGAQHPRCLGQHLGFIAGEVDHAVGDHHVDACVRERELLEISLAELHVLDSGLGGVALGELEHLVGHVNPDRPAGRTNAAGGDQHVSAGAGAEVEHDLALVQVSDRGRDPAPERRSDRTLGHVIGLGIERRAEHTGRVRRAAASGGAAG